MEKALATVKVDTEENWSKAKNYIPDSFTIIVYSNPGKAPRVKIGDGVHKVNDLPFLTNKSEVDGNTLIL